MKKQESYKIPEDIKKIMSKIEEAGFNSFIVGGYVRDLLLNKETNDIDICTNAPFYVLKKLFDGKYYKSYGSVHIICDNYNVDITSFRQEFEYENNKPKRVVFTNSLYNDLLRRDFTINALAIDINSNLIDLLNGLDDLKKGKIKVIGSAYERLEEDITRVLRAIRLYNNLDFTLDNEIISFINEKGYLIGTLKKEFIKSELDKIFAEDATKFFEFVEKYNLADYLHLKYDKINTKVTSLYGIWAQIETDLPFRKDDKYIINSIKKVVSSKKIDKLDIYKYGENICQIAGELLNVKIDKLLLDMPIRSIFDIDITYNEISEITESKNINKIFREIEKQILSGKLENTNDKITGYLRGKKYE